MSTIDLTPRGLLNGDNNYILQDQGLYDLLKYIWAGLILPRSNWEYAERLRLHEETYSNIEPVITPLIAAYNTTKDHCVTFKDTTYPSITGTADDIVNYAQTAAGHGPEPFFAYANLVETLQQLASTESPSEQATLKKTIGNILDFHLTFINTIISKSQTAVNNLREFESVTMTDRQTILLCQAAVVKTLDMDLETLDTLQRHLADYRHDIQVDVRDYEKDLIRASKAPSWDVLVVFGLRPSGFFRRMADRLSEAIQYFTGLANVADVQLAEERCIVAALAATESDLTSLLGAMSPAVTMVQEMMGAWQGISEDLASISQAMEEDIQAVNAIVARIIEEKIAEKWETLAAAADRFRQASNITDVQLETLDQMEKDKQGTIV
ncbi:uncharacterized protein SCHCODRAFT_02625792 [Schizophyllum commune H4-8]|uniref:Expressed protein n=1 Tax=Schizophyllum commune (strain H4-8 / FGSC 9210) TaxID=578458 RepID=D8Q588_SCHCM|nr:uncharacterized protein SCHCODRAFT_02625792 [Schizophyllum commune H4-8]KAI5892290.1 hypothetical protein SCHCODRAFT_02625792 [Schizophyllum commune H4-8]